MNAKVLCTFILIMFSSVLMAATKTITIDSDTKPKTADWGYKGNIGPTRWAELSSDFTLCADGKSQSPINIPQKTVPGNNALVIGYTPASLNIMNDGLTDLQMGSKHISINDGHSVQLNFSADTNEGIIFDKTAFRLVELHFHAPSETTLLGMAYPLEIHFVHQSDQGEIAVLAVFAKGGAEHPELQTIVNHIPNHKGVVFRITGKTINPANLLPDKKSFFTYAGSLTTPPCYEGVRWIVMSEPIIVSPAQIARIKQAVGGNNARPVQRLNDRTVNYIQSDIQSVS